MDAKAKAIQKYGAVCLRCEGSFPKGKGLTLVRFKAEGLEVLLCQECIPIVKVSGERTVEGIRSLRTQEEKELEATLAAGKAVRPEDSYQLPGESFLRPKWHLSVYGGSREQRTSRR